MPPAARNAFNCSFTAGLYIDGDPVAGSALSATVPQGTVTFDAWLAGETRAATS